jgi:multicomponent K+:H+ antiporter subunit C
VEAIVALSIGALVACGVYLLLRARTYPVILGIMMLGYGVNLFLVAMARITPGAPPIIQDGVSQYVDPLPQALVLTAIVIGFGMAAFVVLLALRAGIAAGTDHVDGEERL